MPWRSRRNVRKAGAEVSTRNHMPAEEPIPTRKRRELIAFFVLAVLIWPFIAIGVVGAYGLVVWIYYMFTGPPGPV